MSLRRLLALSGSLLLSGCVYNARERTDQMVCDLATHPMDIAPSTTHVTGQVSRSDKAARPAGPAIDMQTTALLSSTPPPPPGGIKQIAFQQPDAGRAQVLSEVEAIKNKFKIPSDLPGADATPIPNQFSKDPAIKLQQLRAIYATLPPLPEVPKAQPGPNGAPYTLADLQQIAAANSPALRQAASDVEAARGNLITAAAYPNPQVGYQLLPSNDGTSAGQVGFTFQQEIKVFGKLQLQAAAAKRALDNAELALKRAHSDLATQVRTAYFALLVADEQVRVNRSLARFTDDVYALQIKMMEPGFAAPYEPAALRAQAYTVRLALFQAIQNYNFAWKQLVAAIGERQLPLSQVAGRIDSMIPYYDYDAVLAHVLKEHTDVLTARNAIDVASANLKLQQISPYGDPTVSIGLAKEMVAPPRLWTQTVGVTVPIPLWDQNKGGIVSAEAALVRAMEEPHHVEQNLTTNLSNAYNNYTNNLAALEYYRRYILPDLVRTYQSVYQRRGIDQGVVFGDVVQAQQTLVTNVGTYLTILGQLWTSVTGVADFLQTDNLFQVGQTVGLPPLPDFDQIPGWPCCHPCGTGAACGSVRTGSVNDGHNNPILDGPFVPDASGSERPAAPVAPTPIGAANPAPTILRTSVTLTTASPASPASPVSPVSRPVHMTFDVLPATDGQPAGH